MSHNVHHRSVIHNLFGPSSRGEQRARYRWLAAMIASVFASVGVAIVAPRPAEAQESTAYVIVPKLESFNIGLRPNENIQLGWLVDFIPRYPDVTSVLAAAGATGGVRLNGTAGVTRSTLAELLKTVITATTGGTITLIVDSRVNIGGAAIVNRSSVAITVRVVSTNNRMTPTASPFRISIGTTYRWRDLVTYEKLASTSNFSNYGFEVTGGVKCADAAAKPVPCPPVPKNWAGGPVYTQAVLDQRFVATGSGRIVAVLLYGSGRDILVERFPIDIEATPATSAPPPPPSASPGAAFLIAPLTPLPSVTSGERVPLGKFVAVQQVVATAQITSITFQTSAGALINGASIGAIPPSIEALLGATVTASSDGGVTVFIQALAIQPGQINLTPSASQGSVSVKFIAPRTPR